MNILGGDLLGVFGRAVESDGLYFVPARLWLDDSRLMKAPRKWGVKNLECPTLTNGIRSAFRVTPHLLRDGANIALLAVSLTGNRALPLLVESVDDDYGAFQQWLLLKDRSASETYRDQVLPAFIKLIEHAHNHASEPWAEVFDDGWQRSRFGFDGQRIWEVHDGYDDPLPWEISRWEEEDLLLSEQIQQAEAIEASWEFPVENPYELDVEDAWPPENQLICPSCAGSGMIIDPCESCDSRGLIPIRGLGESRLKSAS